MEKVGVFFKIQHKCCMIGTKIFNIGLPTSSSFFWVIIPSILKGLVPNMKHLCWIFQNTQTFSISEGFYGRPLKQGSHFFRDTLYDDGTLSHYHTNLYLVSLYRGGNTSMVDMAIVIPGVLNISKQVTQWAKSGDTGGKSGRKWQKNLSNGQQKTGVCILAIPAKVGQCRPCLDRSKEKVSQKSLESELLIVVSAFFGRYC